MCGNNSPTALSPSSPSSHYPFLLLPPLWPPFLSPSQVLAPAIILVFSPLAPLSPWLHRNYVPLISPLLPPFSPLFPNGVSVNNIPPYCLSPSLASHFLSLAKGSSPLFTWLGPRNFLPFLNSGSCMASPVLSTEKFTVLFVLFC